MVRAIREIVTVEEGGVVRLRSSELEAGSRVELIILPTTDATAEVPDLLSLWGAGRGVYSSAAEADAFIRAERDAWED